jgi:hypothetical protein
MLRSLSLIPEAAGPIYPQTPRIRSFSPRRRLRISAEKKREDFWIRIENRGYEGDV